MFGKPPEILPGFGTKSKLNESHLFEWQREMKRENYFSSFHDVPVGVSGPQRSAFLRRDSADLKGWSGRGARAVTGTANRINDYLARKGRGYIEGGFKTVGEVVEAMPLKSMAMSYGFGLGIMGVVEFGISGKPITMANMFQVATDNLAFTLGSELAGTGIKGIAKYAGWQMLGSELGLGTWGSLGLQVAGSIALPGLGWGLGAGMLAYKAGKGLYQGARAIHDLGAASRSPEFTTRDTSWQTQNAATMRERSLGAIQNSHLNLRSVLGNEARMLMMAR